ncbi:MAG TPA: sigma 54-interacting transcriptional regulator [Pseudomonas sp.]
MLEAVSVASRQLFVVEPATDCDSLFSLLRAAGWTLHRSSLEKLAAQAGDVVLIHLEDQPDPALLRQIEQSPACWVALLDAQPQTMMNELLGGRFFAAHPLPLNAVSLLDTLQQSQVFARLRKQQAETKVRQWLGNSSQARSLRQQVHRLSSGQIPLLITGEAGSGKTLLARLLHEHSARAPQALIRFDCARDEDGLFGEKGPLAAAKTTTVILDGVAGVSMQGQQRLLRYLQSHPDLALVVISRGELEQALLQGHLRDDLYRLLAGQQLHTIRLREQHGDMLLLAEHFARLHGAAFGRRQRCFSEDAIEAMTAHAWPGNVRELCNRVIRAMALTLGRQIRARDLGLEVEQGRDSAAVTLEDYILRAERQALNDVLARYTNNMSQAARRLGISRPTFYRLLHKHRLR